MKLIKDIKKLMKTDVKNTVDNRIKEFNQFKNADDKSVFKELCFCILTANYSAEGAIRIHSKIGDGFCCFNQDELSKKFREYGYRFPNVRANYVVCNQKYSENICSHLSGDEHEIREWIVKNIKGLGYKEASHFMRNIGYENVAIIDFHIVDILDKYGLIERPKTLTKNNYLEIEKVLDDLSKKIGINLAELDLYLWYMETGKVLK